MIRWGLVRGIRKNIRQQDTAESPPPSPVPDVRPAAEAGDLWIQLS
jgi:hypothetical protein